MGDVGPKSSGIIQDHVGGFNLCNIFVGPTVTRPAVSRHAVINILILGT